MGVTRFLAMGGYAAYVWAAFGFALVVMAGLFAQSWVAARRRGRELAELRSRLRPARGARSPARPLVARREAVEAETREGA